MNNLDSFEKRKSILENRIYNLTLISENEEINPEYRTECDEKIILLKEKLLEMIERKNRYNINNGEPKKIYKSNERKLHGLIRKKKLISIMHLSTKKMYPNRSSKRPVKSD